MTYFLAPDADREPTIWQHDPERPDYPKALLRKCDLSADARPVLWPVIAAHVPPMRTFVIAPNMQAAHAVAREEEVAPYARTTILVTRPDRLRGHAIRPWDRVVWSAAPWANAYRVLDEIDANLYLARLAGGSV